MIKCINAAFKGARQREKGEEKEGRQTGVSISTGEGEETKCCKENPKEDGARQEEDECCKIECHR